ncbi:Amino acid permease 1 [Nymphaea thermarum]|nr:Amino acid permease 1 [Nymphaea thermarum]
MLIFAAVTVLSSWLLADCYRSPDPETGSIINHTYMHSVRQHLVRWTAWPAPRKNPGSAPEEASFLGGDQHRVC